MNMQEVNSPKENLPKENLNDYFVPLYREPAAARLAYRLVWLNFIQAMLIFCLVGTNVFLYTRRPERVVIKEDKSGEEVLMINDRSFGEIKNLSIKPDSPTTGGKIFTAKEFASLLFDVDLSTRRKAIKRVLGMMPQASANTLYQYLLKNTANPTNDAGVALERERSENWAAQFQMKDVSLDARDPNTINIIGTQKITKNMGGSTSEAERDVQLAVKVHPDVNGRQDYNLQTGFQVISYIFKELPR